MDEYALHRGVSKGAISQACSAKRITPVESFQGKKKSLFFDVLVCDADWLKNSRPKKTDLPPPPIITAKKAGRPTNAQLEAKAYLNATLPKTAPTPMPRGVKQPFTDFGDLKPSRKAPQELTEEQKESIELARRKNIASTEKLEADAMKSRIEVEKDAGQLAYIEDIEDLFSEMVVDARDRFMSLTSVLKTKFSDLKKEHLDFINSFHMEIFMSLSRKNDRQVIHIENRIKDK